MGERAAGDVFTFRSRCTAGMLGTGMPQIPDPVTEATRIPAVIHAGSENSTSFLPLANARRSCTGRTVEGFNRCKTFKSLYKSMRCMTGKRFVVSG